MPLPRGSQSSGKELLVDKQMRKWESSRKLLHGIPLEQRPEVAPFLTISRRFGSGGAEVARAVGERLNWPVFDKEILDHMAGDDEVRRSIHASMDEREVGWFEETLRSFMQKEFVRNDYFNALVDTALSLASQGSAIFLGRAIDMILPQDRGFRVRAVASWDHSARHYAEVHGGTVEEAMKVVREQEASFDDFIRKHFKVELNEATRFDLVVNVERLGVDKAADLILRGMKLRGVV